MVFHVQIDQQNAFPKLGGHKSQPVLHHVVKNNGNETKQLKWSGVHNPKDDSTEYDWQELYIHPICFYVIIKTKIMFYYYHYCLLSNISSVMVIESFVMLKHMYIS